MADLRIADAPEIALEDITGNEKIPTGGYGNSAVTINNLGQFAKTALSLATESHVSNAVGQKEDKITLTGVDLTPSSTYSDIPQTNNNVLNTVHQDLLNRMEWIKDNVTVVTDHQALTNRSTFNTHPSSSISHNGTSNVSIEIEELKNDVLTINTTTVPELENAIVGKQDVIVNDINLSETSVFSDVPSTNNSALNNSLQTLVNRDKFIDDNIKTGLPPLFNQSFADAIGGYPLNTRLMLNSGDIVRSTVANNTTNPNNDMTGWVKINSASQIFDQDGNSLQEANDFLKSQVKYDNYGIVAEDPLKTYVQRLPIQGIFKMDGTDETETFKAYIAVAKALGKPLVLPKGTIYISDTVDIDFRLELSGAGRDQTYIRFKNTIANKRMFVFKRGSGMSDWRNFTLLDNKHGTSEGIVFTDSRNDVGAAVWKCLFTLIEIRGFAVSHRYTSNNPLDGGSHAHCSEILWHQCRFSNNKITAIVENCQAVNNMYIKCDGENFDTAYLDENIVDANWQFFVDYAGGGINIIGGSWIGRGKLFSWLYPAGGTGLFQGSGAFKGQDIRFELRPTYNGVIIEEGIHGNAGTSMHMSIEVTNLKTLNYGATVDLFRFAGRCKAVFKNCEPVFGAGRLVVRQYPTLGRSSNTTIGAMADVLVENCGTTFYEKETSTPYGTYDRSASANVIVRNNHPATTNQAYSTDAQGFRVLNCGGDIQQLGQSFNGSLSPSRLAFNNDNPSAGFVNASQHKFCIPKYGRPLKAFMYKMAVRHAFETSVDLYLVKDVAQWAGSTFDVGTDAVLVASGPLTVNKSGYFEVPINLTSNIVGNAFQSGFDSWLEGRMMFVIKGGNTFSGFFGVEYI